jgi:hypothetical protein
MRILVLDVERRQEIQSLQVLGKLRCPKISKRKGHTKESKALAISIFRSREAHFLEWSSLAED